MKSVKIQVFTLSVCLCASMLGAVFSGTASAETIIMATVNNGPLMNSVELEVRQAVTNALIVHTPKHSTVLSLAPGDYIATIKAGDIVRKREFSVLNTTGTNNIVVAMD